MTFFLASKFVFLNLSFLFSKFLRTLSKSETISFKKYMTHQFQKSNFYILFIDDEEKSVKYFEKAFGEDFNIIATTNPDDFWKIFNAKSNQIAVVVSDQRMPDQKGTNLLAQIKEKNSDIIRILTTAYSSLEDSIEAINKSNVFAYLTKPWDFNEIRTILYLALNEFERKRKYLSLSSSIAHEMRNPLHSLRQSTEFIRNKLSEAHLNEKYCGNSTEEKIIPLIKKDFSEIIDSLDLAFSSARRGNIVIDIILSSIRGKPIDTKSFRNIPVSEVMEIIMREYSFTENERGRVAINIDQKQNFILRCSDTLLSYVFFNLFKNSFYYISSHPNLTIQIRAESGNDDFNRIYFRDNGPGIHKDKIPNLFEAFSTFGKEGGTGLGLAFCKRSLESFGGSISCNSVEGEFTEFVLAFPKITEGLNRPNSSILLVDDQETNLLTTKKLLEKNLESTQCDLAKGGEESIQLAKKNNYDLIIMDIEMPEINGLMAAKKIREFDKTTPIIAYSSRSLEEVSESLKNSGFNGYVAKHPSIPSIDTLLKTASKWGMIRPKKSFLIDSEIKRILENKHILLADDDKTNLIIASKFLKNYNAKVEEVENGEAALEMVKKNHFDLILMDIGMPKMNGIITAKKIREFQKENNINPVPIIAFTGDNEREKINEILNSGFDDYFIKGSDPSELTETIAFWNNTHYGLFANSIK
jgi:two-component system CAI-1 autoinducer sensor kinase/phosphatase CqsS